MTDLLAFLSSKNAFPTAIIAYERRMEREQRRLDRMVVELRRAREIHKRRRLDLTKRTTK